MPFIPYIIGAAVGAAVTYVAKDDPSKQLLKDTSGKVTSGVGSLTGKVSGMFKKSEEVTEEIAEEVAEDAEDAVVA